MSLEFFGKNKTSLFVATLTQIAICAKADVALAKEKTMSLSEMSLWLGIQSIVDSKEDSYMFACGISNCLALHFKSSEKNIGSIYVPYDLVKDKYLRLKEALHKKGESVRLVGIAHSHPQPVIKTLLCMKMNKCNLHHKVSTPPSLPDTVYTHRQLSLLFSNIRFVSLVFDGVYIWKVENKDFIFAISDDDIASKERIVKRINELGLKIILSSPDRNDKNAKEFMQMYKMLGLSMERYPIFKVRLKSLLLGAF